MQKSNPSSNDRVSVENGTYSTMEHNDETSMRVSKIHKFEILLPVPWPLEEFLPKFTEPKSPVNTVPLEFCAQDLVAKFYQLPQKITYFPISNLPKQPANSPTTLPRLFATSSSMAVLKPRSACFMSAAAACKAAEKREPVWNCGRKGLYGLQDFYIAYLHTYIDTYIHIFIYIYTNSIRIYIYSIKSVHVLHYRWIYLCSKKTGTWNAALYHDGLWSLSTIGKDYLAVEMASIMVHLTSAKWLIWGLLEH